MSGSINESGSTGAKEPLMRVEARQQDDGNWQKIGDLARRIAEKAPRE